MKYWPIMIIIFCGNLLLSQNPLVKRDTSALRVELDSIEERLPDTLGWGDLPMTELTIKGKVYPAIVTEDGDTIIIAEDVLFVSITSMRKFASDEEYQKYRKFRRYANIVYPYAREAILLFRELEYADQYLSKKEKKNKIKELQEQLKQDFEEPLKKLTKLQGKIMIKMIERELDETMYNLIKGLKGRFTAFYWHHFSKLYSYDLKEGYNVGNYPILDAVLQDFDLSYKIEHGTDLKYVKLEKK